MPGRIVAVEPPVRRFERIASESPDVVAVDCDGQQFTYGGLEARARRLAMALRARGVTAGSPVAVCLQPSLDLIAAMLATWKAGGAYLPVDPALPLARVEAMLADARPVLLLGDRPRAPVAGVGSEAIDELCCGAEKGMDLVDKIDPEQPATIFYTSGTTGHPKGVVASHRNLEFYLSSARERYGFEAADRFCSVARSAFSISLFEQLSPLLCGASLRLLTRASVLDPARLAAALEGVTVLHAGPSLLGRLLDHLDERPPGERRLTGVRHASTGGDLVPPRLLERMAEAFPRAERFVIYGCTEVCCMATTLAVPRGQAPRGAVVGRPFAGVMISIERDGAAVPRGVEGEIVIAGPGVARPLGQRGADRFGQRGGLRSYATGDLGRLRDDGSLELLGRKDDQIQLNGVRIELAEIDLALRRLPGVREAAAVDCARPCGGKALVAFVVSDTFDAALLRRGLAAELPDTMMPTDLLPIERLPLSENLKVSRAALRAEAARRLVERPAEGVRVDDIEACIGALFARVLGVEPPGLDHDFFALGGSSLLALRLTDAVASRFAIALPSHTLFQHPTARALAAVVRARRPPAPGPVLLGGRADLPPLFLLAAIQGYRGVARELEEEYAVYGLSLDDDEGEPPPGHLASLAARYAALLAGQRGPLRIGGHSFGGVLAFEAAQQLWRAGRAVEHLWLIDAILPWQRGDLRRRAARFVGLGWGERGRLVAEAMAPRRAASGPALDPVEQAEERRKQRQLAAVKAYLPAIAPYRGAATLVTAGRRLAESPLRDPHCGWRQHIDRLEVRCIDAHHAELLEAPWAPRLAEAFRARRGGQRSG